MMQTDELPPVKEVKLAFLIVCTITPLMGNMEHKY